VQIGDRFTEVNGKRATEYGVDEISREIRESDVLNIMLARDPSPSELSDPVPAIYNVKLDKAEGTKLGFGYATDTLEIMVIKSGGLVAAWNESNPLHFSVHEGDKIVEVNGKSCAQYKPEDLHAAIQKDVVLEMTLARPTALAVCIHKTLGAKLGIKYDEGKRDVTSIDSNGLVAEWNRRFPEATVRLGDRISRVNDRSTIAEFSREMQQSQVVQICFARKVSLVALPSTARPVAAVASLDVSQQESSTATDLLSTLEVAALPSEELPNKPILADPKIRTGVPVIPERRPAEEVKQTQAPLISTETEVVVDVEDNTADSRALIENQLERGVTLERENSKPPLAEQLPTESLLSEPIENQIERGATLERENSKPPLAEQLPTDSLLSEHPAEPSVVPVVPAILELSGEDEEGVQSKAAQAEVPAIEVCLLGFGGAGGPPPAMVSGVKKLFFAQGLRASWAQSSEYVADAEVLVSAGVPVGADVLDKAPALKLLATTASSPSFDGIDVSACHARGIEVVRLPNCDSGSSAEVIISLVLSQMRQLAPCQRMMQNGLWAAPVQEELQTKTIGIVGVGSLGVCLANLFRGFKVRQILGYSPVTNCRAFAAKDSVIGKAASLTELLIDSDIICVCIPLTPRTQGLISEPLLGLLRPDSLLVSTSRGVIDEAALSKMLAEERFRAALDFTGTNPLEDRSPLRSLPAEQLLLVPPVGNQNCPEAHSAMALKSLPAFLAEHPFTFSDKEWFE